MRVKTTLRRSAPSLLVTSLLFGNLLGAETIKPYPPGTVLENIAISSAGDLFVTSLLEGIIYKVSPSGASLVFGQVPGELAGIAFGTDGTLVGAGQKSFYQFAPDGTSSLVTNVSSAGYLNGVTPFRPDTFLVADDGAATIWKIDLSTRSASEWLVHDLLAAPPNGLPIGANGIKLFRGAAYISNTGAETIVRVPIVAGGAAGAPEVYASSIAADDFAFGADGSVFATTQTGFLFRLHPDGTRTTIPTGTLGDAALAFGRTAADRQHIYVVNNGGAFFNLPGGPQAATILRLGTDTTGVVPETQAVPEPETVFVTGAGFAVMLLLSKRCSRNHAR
ncbi:MAG TPA: hypothetical protein VES20_23415 [Bryobacteraceae bacterium]|nr:hypothetical protein [Bryobacteraceae bacterium]